MDVEGKERDESRTKTSMEESRMDDEGERGRLIQKFDSAEHQATNCGKNIIGRGRQNGGSDHSRVVGWDP